MRHIESEKHKQGDGRGNGEAQTHLKHTARRADARHHRQGEEQSAEETADVGGIINFHAGESAAEVDGKTDDEIDRGEINYRLAQTLELVLKQLWRRLSEYVLLTTPSKPLDFLAQIGVLGLGKCKSSLRCPASLTIPFPAVFYSYETTSHGRAGKSEDGPSPYVGQIDLENTLPQPKRSSRQQAKATEC